MSLPSLTKPCHIDAPGVWAVFNMGSGVTASHQGYLLTIADDPAPRLDDLAPEQENAFWAFNFSQIKTALDKPEVFFKRPDLDYEPGVPTHMMCAVNDGWAAGQSVGQVHGHVIGLDSTFAEKDLGQLMMADREAQGRSSEPLGYTEVKSCEDMAVGLRTARKSLKECFASAVDPAACGYSIYTKQPAAKGGTPSLIVELWTRDHPSPWSVTSYVRHWQKLTDGLPASRKPDLQFSGFAKEPRSQAL